MYTTQANIESRLGEALSTEQAAYFNNVLSEAISGYIDLKTETTFGSVDVSDVYVDGDGGSTLLIPTMHDITSVSKVENDDSEEALAVTDYRPYPRSSANKLSIRKLNGYWSDGFENYKVTGKLGHAAVPADITLVATELATSLLTANTNNYKSEKVGDWAVTYAEAERSISQESDSILASYRRLSRSM